jgi:hypothetical protein
MGGKEKEITKLQQRASKLQKELKDDNKRLGELNDPEYKTNASSGKIKALDGRVPNGPRFVNLNRGCISYYYSYLESAP